MGEKRPDIPEPLQRAVRQHCGFGCAICGSMPTTIEHILDWRICKEHRFENLVLLCANHQQDSTAGSISRESLLRARGAPFSKVNNRASYGFGLDPVSYVRVAGFLILVRTNMEINVVSLDERPLFSIRIEDGHPLYTINLKDFSGRPTFSMVENMIALSSNNLWDASKRGVAFRVLHGSHRVFVDIRIERSELIVRHIRMAAFGYGIHITKDSMSIGYGIDQPSSSYRGNILESEITRLSLLSLGMDRDLAQHRLGVPGNLSNGDAMKWLWQKKRKEF